ncbi:MAG: ecdysteroid 22-kinase family protein, partial [Pseudomonadales bacterium]|nr:ecdysteroid 22-kinase family protein [Pseudomonadales bacterium]
MNEDFQALVLEATGATSLTKKEDIQSLWSGYGSISRFQLDGSDHNTVVIKHVKLPDQQHHPRGWNTDFSHQRKIKSYHVETAWYGIYSQLCNTQCRVPACLAYEDSADEFLMVLEDLDAAGFSQRVTSADLEQMQACLKWLASFHATFMGQSPEKLWQVGTYWHLDTRPDELAALQDEPLKSAANKIDQLLKDASYQTFVHGDAKLANFCFSSDSNQVAAVDFQY